MGKDATIYKVYLKIFITGLHISYKTNQWLLTQTVYNTCDFCGVSKFKDKASSIFDSSSFRLNRRQFMD